ncbi:MAG TPA: calcium/sodium antiporter [Bacteroidales bacterium]|nr:calcium/sodium antiporter [Bacteroidales bacterium]
MEILINALIFIVSVLALAKGSSIFVDAAVKIARWFNIPTLVIGLTVVAFGTSAPEFGVTLLSAAQGLPDITVGNIIGSNIFNLGFILGGTALVRSLNTDNKLVYRDGAFLLGGTVLLTLLIWDLSIGPIGGAILFSLLIIYIVFLLFQKDKKAADEVPEKKEKVRWTDVLLFFIGLGMIIAGAHFLVEASTKIARIIGLSDFVIAVTIVAFGTSAPELATSITASIKGHHGISAGNLIGSDIFNIFGVLGLTAMMNDLTVESGAHSNLLVLIGMVLLVIFFMRTHWKITRWEGAILIAIGLLRWFYSFYPGG